MLLACAELPAAISAEMAPPTRSAAHAGERGEEGNGLCSDVNGSGGGSSDPSLAAKLHKCGRKYLVRRRVSSLLVSAPRSVPTDGSGNSSGIDPSFLITIDVFPSMAQSRRHLGSLSFLRTY